MSCPDEFLWMVPKLLAESFVRFRVGLNERRSSHAGSAAMSSLCHIHVSQCPQKVHLRVPCWAHISSCVRAMASGRHLCRSRQESWVEDETIFSQFDTKLAPECASGVPNSSCQGSQSLGKPVVHLSTLFCPDEFKLGIEAGQRKPRTSCQYKFFY